MTQMQPLPVEALPAEDQDAGRAIGLKPDLERLTSDVCALGHLAEQALAESVDVLQYRMSSSKRTEAPREEFLIKLERQFTVQRVAVKVDGLTLLVRRQPRDGDLRTIAALLDIVGELENLASYAMDVARTHTSLLELEGQAVGVLPEMQRWAARTRDRLHRVLEALVQQDVPLARAVHSDGTEAETLFRQIHYEVSRFGRDRSRATLAPVALNLKRAADCVTGICEWVVYAVSGTMIQS